MCSGELYSDNFNVRQPHWRIDHKCIFLFNSSIRPKKSFNTRLIGN
jgi:hypothetical protein